MRKPIGVATDESGTTVVCDDGAVFFLSENSKVHAWIEFPPVPGTERADFLIKAGNMKGPTAGYKENK